MLREHTQRKLNLNNTGFQLYVLTLIGNYQGYLLPQNAKKKNSRPFLTNQE